MTLVPASALGVLGVPCYFCEVLLRQWCMPAVPLVSLVSVVVSVRCCGDSGSCSDPGVLGVLLFL